MTRAARVCALLLLLGLFAPAADAWAQRNALFYIREGERAVAARDYRTAVHQYRLALERNPASAQAHAGAALAYYSLGDYGRAREHYARATELDAGFRAARIGLGLSLIRMGRFADAETQLAKVRSADPANPDNNFAYGLLHYHRGNRRLAEQFFERTLRLKPAHTAALIELARLKADDNRFDLAEEYLRRARLIEPGRSDLASVQGHILLRQAFAADSDAERADRLNSAAEAFETALRLTPDDFAVERQLAVIELYRNRPEQALMRAESALEANPDDGELQYLAGALAARGGANQAQRAAQHLERALESNPSDGMARLSLEELAIGFPDVFPAQGALRRRLAQFRFERALRAESSRRMDLFEAHLRRALQLNPMHERALRYELDRLRRAGAYEGFIAALTRMRRMRPDDLNLRTRLEVALEERRRYMAYRENLIAPEADPDNANYARTPARIFVFDLRPEESFPRFPDGPDRLARALQFELGRSGRLRAVDPRLRELALASAREVSSQPGIYAYGVYYRPEHLGRIEEAERRSGLGADYIVAGSFRSVQDGLRVQLDLIDKATASRLDRFTIEASGRDAVTEIMIKAYRRLLEKIPVRGKVIRISGDRVFINIGAADGVKPGDQFRAQRNGAERGLLKVVETSAYAARCEAVNGDPDRLDAGDALSRAPAAAR